MVSALKARISDDREPGEEEDAVAVGEAVATRAELPRRVAVLGQDRAEHGEAVERGVGGQDQDDAGHGQDEVEARREVAEHRRGDLRDHRVLVVALRAAALRRLGEPIEVVRIDEPQAHAGWPGR